MPNWLRLPAGVIAGMSTKAITLDDTERDILLTAADLVTRARTGVEYDYQGNVIDAHAPEMPTRFAKQLFQVARGAVAIGVPRREALRLAIRCARDTVPPLRLAIIDDLVNNPHSKPWDVRKRLNKPRTTIDRQMQALHMLEVLDCDEVENESNKPGKDSYHTWHYTLADGISPDALDPDLCPDLADPLEEEVADNPPTGGSAGDRSLVDFVGVADSGHSFAGACPRCRKPLGRGQITRNIPVHPVCADDEEFDKYYGEAAS